MPPDSDFALDSVLAKILLVFSVGTLSVVSGSITTLSIARAISLLIAYYFWHLNRNSVLFKRLFVVGPLLVLSFSPFRDQKLMTQLIFVVIMVSVVTVMVILGQRDEASGNNKLEEV
jgi:hypothetical protein